MNALESGPANFVKVYIVLFPKQPYINDAFIIVRFEVTMVINI